MKKSGATTVSIKIPKMKVFAKESKFILKENSNRTTNHEKIANRRTVSPSMKSRLLPEIEQPRGKTFDKETFLTYRLYEKNLGRIKRMQLAAIKLENKYKIKYDDLRNRLHVDDPVNDVKTITDIDKRFYKYLQNIDRTEYIPMYKSLRFIWNDQIRMKQEICIRKDIMLRLDMTNRYELEVYDKSVIEYKEHVKQFDTFISEDYAKSIKVLRKSDKLHNSKIVSTLLELEHYATLQCVTQSQLLAIDYLYHTQQKYGRFLYYLSPPSWRAKHRDFAHSLEIEATGFDLGISTDEDPFQVTFERLRNECISGLIKPVLYFSDPSEVATILETIEKQQLHHFAHVVRLHPLTEQLKYEIKYLRLCIKKDTDFLAQVIGDIEKLIDFNEKRARQLKDKFMKMLHGMFFDRVASRDTLMLKMNIEWCYEKLFMEKSTLSLRDTAKSLEDMYMKYTYDLDAISNNDIEKALKQYIAEEKEKMNKARNAAKELRLFNVLEKSLWRAYGKKSDKVNEIAVPVTKIKQSSTRKMKGIQVKNTDTKRRSGQRVLTEAEMEYLTLFTNWTENEDPAKYMMSY